MSYCAESRELDGSPCVNPAGHAGEHRWRWDVVWAEPERIDWRAEAASWRAAAILLRSEMRRARERQANAPVELRGDIRGRLP